MVNEIQTLIPDVYLGLDGNLRIIFEVFGGVGESVFLAISIQSDDMFVRTASGTALEKHGSQYGVPLIAGTLSHGEVKFSGAGGTYVPIGTVVASDPQTGIENVLYFNTIEDGTLPNPGISTAPTTALGAAGNVTGFVEYVVTFITTEGETIAGPESVGLNAASQQVNLTAISLGGPGTVGRKIYRATDGGDPKLVTTISDNTTTAYTDNIAVGSLGGSPPAESTAEALLLDAESDEVGTIHNVQPGMITVLADAPDGLTTVTNPAPFTGGSDEEDIEHYRQRVMEQLRNPQTGSPSDLKAWAESVPGVETATVYENDNLGTPTNGHVTVRISGPGGSVPTAETQTAVLEELEEQDIANITIHVGVFTGLPTNVTVNVTEDSPDYSLADVTPNVQTAISDYINGLDVGGTLYIAGIIDAVWGVPGVLDVTVTVPATNLTTPATQKRTPGVISVT